MPHSVSSSKRPFDVVVERNVLISKGGFEDFTNAKRFVLGNLLMNSCSSFCICMKNR